MNNPTIRTIMMFALLAVTATAAWADEDPYADNYSSLTYTFGTSIAKIKIDGQLWRTNEAQAITATSSTNNFSIPDDGNLTKKEGENDDYNFTPGDAASVSLALDLSTNEWITYSEEPVKNTINMTANELMSVTTKVGEAEAQAATITDGKISNVAYGAVVTAQTIDGYIFRTFRATKGETELTATALAGKNRPTQSDETYDKLFDSNTGTKWCCVTNQTDPYNKSNPDYVIWKTSEPMTTYTLTTGNDCMENTGRNWKSWTIYAGNFDSDEAAKDANSDNWTEIQKIENGELPDDNFGTKDFTIFGNTSSYLYYKLVIDDIVNSSDNVQQMAEMTIWKSDVTFNANASQATFTMADDDMNVNYEITRDMNVSVTTTLNGATLGGSNNVLIGKEDNNYIAIAPTIVVKDVLNDANTTLNTENHYLLTITNSSNEVVANFAEPGQYTITIVGKGAYNGKLTYTVNVVEGAEATIAAGEFITYYRDDANVTLDAEETDVKLYTITAIDLSDAQATATQLTVAGAGTPMLVYNSSEAGKTILLINTSAEATSGVTAHTSFKGTMTGKTFTDTATKDYFACTGKAFAKVNADGTIAAHRCWLEIDAAGTRSLTVAFDDNTTGIDTLNSDKSDSNGDWYDLLGRKLQGKPTQKGLFIRNGKKVVIK